MQPRRGEEVPETSRCGSDTMSDENKADPGPSTLRSTGSRNYVQAGPAQQPGLRFCEACYGLFHLPPHGEDRCAGREWTHRPGRDR